MAKKRILHIEDNPSNRKAVQHILRATDYSLVEAANGEEGITRALEEDPDLILLDIQLPKVSGYDVARRLRSEEKTKDVPIIAVTSYALSGDEETAAEMGCNDYISKPYRPKVLLEHIHKYLKETPEAE